MLKLVEEQLGTNPRRLGKVAVAIGGFIIMVGMIMIGVFALAFFGIFDIGAFMNTEYLAVFMIVLLITGVLDLIAGIILSRE